MPTWKPSEPRPSRPTMSELMRDWRMYSAGASNQDRRREMNRAMRRSLLRPVIKGKESANQLMAIALLKAPDGPSAQEVHDAHETARRLAKRYCDAHSY